MSSQTRTRSPMGTGNVGADDARVTGRIPFWNAVAIVARREIRTRLKSKGFVVPTLIVLGLILLVSLVGPRVGEMISGTDTIAVTAQTQAAVDGLGEDFEALPVDSAQAARDAVSSGEADAAVVAGDGPLGITVIGERDTPSSLMTALSASPDVELLDPDAPNPALASVIGIAFGVVYLMAAMTFGMTMAQSVVEEKQTRIVEIILAAVPARAILAGKILGNSVLAFGQVGLYAAASLVAIGVNGATLPVQGLGAPILWFVVLFAMAFVVLATLFGAAASLVSRQEDIGSATTPVMWLAMFPYIAIILLANNPVGLHVLSYIPFSAPVAVPMRVFTGDALWWQNLLSVLILVVTMVLANALAARIYERSVLKTGKALKWREALRANAD